MSGNETDNVHEYDMTIPWDVSTLSFLQTAAVSQGAPRGLYFKPDGTKFYIARFSGFMTEWTMTTPWDISTSSQTANFNVLSSAQAVWFKPDGLSLYISQDTVNLINQFDLSSAWDLSTASDPSISFDTSTEVTFLLATSFRSDGRSMYAMGDGNINEYELSTPWDITSAVPIDSKATGISANEVIFKPDGTTFFSFDNLTDLIHEFDLGISTSVISSISGSVRVDTNLLIPTGVAQKNIVIDGDAGSNGLLFDAIDTGAGTSSTLFIGNALVDVKVSDGVNNVGFDVDAVDGMRIFDGISEIGEFYHADYSANGISVKGDRWIPDVGHVKAEIRTPSIDAATFLDSSTQSIGATPNQFNGQLSAAKERATFSIFAQDDIANSITFGLGGYKFYMVGSQGNDINEYDLTVPWDITTATFLQSFGTSFDLDPHGVFFKPDGTRFYITGAFAQDVEQFDLSTPWDVSTASASGNSSLSAIIAGFIPRTVFFHPTGFKCYIYDANSNDLEELDLSTPWDVTTITSNNVSVTLGAAVFGVAFKADGTGMYVADQTPQIEQYVLGEPWDITNILSVDVLTGFTTPSQRGIYLRPDAGKLYSLDQSGGLVHEYDIGLSVPGPILTDGHNVSAYTSDTIEVFTASDIDDLAVGGTITVTSNMAFIFKADIVSSTNFVIDGGSLTFSAGGVGRNFISTNVGDFISGRGNLRTDGGISFIGITVGRLFNLDQLDTDLTLLRQSNWVGWDDLGTIKGGLVQIESIAILDWLIGLTFQDNRFVEVRTFASPTPNPASGELITVKNFRETSGTYDFSNVQGALAGSGKLFNIDAGNLNSGLIQISNSAQAGGEFFLTGGATGTFSSVGDFSISAQGISSVTDSGGVARFNFTPGPTVYVGQEVVISGYITNTNYNGIFFITATGSGFFETTEIIFGSDEATGSFDSDSVAITEVGTALVDGDTITIATDDATDYDGGATVYNQLVNSFHVNRTFTSTQSGTWDASSVTQSDPRVLAVNNPGIVSSKYIAGAYVNNNSDVTTIPVSNTFNDIDFGTLTESSNTERWKIIDTTNGTFEYTGNEPFDGFLVFDFTGVSSGGAQEFRFKFQHDIGAGFVDLPDNVEALVEVGSTAGSVTKHVPVQAVKGDLLKPEITRNAGTSTITISYATITVL